MLKLAYSISEVISGTSKSISGNAIVKEIKKNCCKNDNNKNLLLKRKFAYMIASNYSEEC